MPTMTLTIIITVLAIVVACLSALIALQIKILHRYHQKLDHQIKLLEEAQAKKIPHEALVGQENVLGAIIGALVRVEDLREEGKAFCMRADAASERVDAALRAAQAWRGINNAPPAEDHNKYSRP